MWKNLTDDIVQLDQKLNATQQKHLKLSSHVLTHGHGNKQLIDKLDQQIKTVQQKQNELFNLSEESSREIQRLDQKMNSTQEKQLVLTSRVDDHDNGNDERIDQLTTKVTSFTNDLETLDQKVKTVLHEQTTLSSGKDAYGGRISLIENKIYKKEKIRLQPIDSNIRKVNRFILRHFESSKSYNMTHILPQGVLLVKHKYQWGTVCDDDFGTTEAQSACHTLGYSGGSYSAYNSGFSGPTWMDNVDCASSTTNFLTCSHPGWGKENCGHSEDVLLTCT